MTIPRDSIFELLAGAPPEGLQPAELGRVLGLDRGRSTQIRDVLQQMVREGLVVRDGPRYALRPDALETPEPEDLVRGLLRVSPRGVGSLDRGEAFDPVTIREDDLGAAIDGDLVEVDAWETRKGRVRGEVVRVVERGRRRVTGTLVAPRRGDSGLVLELDDRRLGRHAEIREIVTDAADGDVVLAEITRYPKTSADPLGVTVTKRLGNPGDLLTEVAKTLAAEAVAEEFPEAVARSVATLPTHGIQPDDLADRLDLRDRHFVTIDPLTARDFDDAVAVEAGPEGTTRIWIAVADVSHYVPEGSPTDREARRRGCSLYLPDRAIPMLPERLSSDVCSLRPNEDRLAMVVRLDITDEGLIWDSDCAAAVIHSRGQLDYGGVAAALEGDFRGRRAGYREHAELLDALRRVTTTLREQRLRRGSLDLDLPEAQIRLDDDDPTRVRQIVSSRASEPIKRAYNLIEELMVAANEVVGQLFLDHDQPTIWRIHPVPDGGAVEKLIGWLASYGVSATRKRLRTPKGMASLARRLASHPAARPLSYLLLRTLRQAIYHVDNQGHFGLASDAYLHFTSPIRRYPDLHVHRLVKHLLRKLGRPAGGASPAQQTSRGALSAIARESSVLERRSLEVEREVHRIYAASLMLDRVGDEHSGTITGITGFGFFVSLAEPFVDGLVKLERLAEPMSFSPELLRLFGRSRVVSLGDELQVKVTAANVVRRQVDYDVQAWGEAAPLPPAIQALQRQTQKAPRKQRFPHQDRSRRGKGPPRKRRR